MYSLSNFLSDLGKISLHLTRGVSLNWVDFLIIIFSFLYAIEGYAVGFLRSSIDFLGFILAFIFALKIYSLPAGFIHDTFSLSIGVSNAFAFLITAFILEAIFSSLFRNLFLKYVLPKVRKVELLKNADNFLGIIPGVLSSLVIMAFILMLIISFPTAPGLKNAASNSYFGGILISYAQGIEKDLNKVFGGAISDTLNFITIEPKSSESVDLKFTETNLTVDEGSERQMLEMVNSERTSRGLPVLLAGDNKLIGVARAHCKDMFERGYFSHYTPEELSPFERMDRANISYSYAGENLALAPNVKMAMQGLMNSPGHKANILSTNFGVVGIGVIDGGAYGKMFCQEFTD